MPSSPGADCASVAISSNAGSAGRPGCENCARAGLEAPRGHVQRRGAEHAQLGVLRRAVVGDDPVARKELAATARQLRNGRLIRGGLLVAASDHGGAAPHEQERAGAGPGQGRAAVGGDTRAAAPPTRDRAAQSGSRRPSLVLFARAGPNPTPATASRSAAKPGYETSAAWKPATSTPSREASPATAPSIASLWSPGRVQVSAHEAARALHHEAVGRRLDARAETAQPLDDRRDPVGLLAAQLLGAVHRRAPLGERTEQRHDRQLVDRERHLGRLHVGAAQLRRAHDDVAHRLAAGSRALRHLDVCLPSAAGCSAGPCASGSRPRRAARPPSPARASRRR